MVVLIGTLINVCIYPDFVSIIIDQNGVNIHAIAYGNHSELIKKMDMGTQLCIQGKMDPILCHSKQIGTIIVVEAIHVIGASARPPDQSPKVSLKDSDCTIREDKIADMLPDDLDSL